MMIVVVAVMVVVAHHMVDGSLISVTESITVGLALLWRKMGTAVLFAVVYIGTAVIIEVLAGSFNAVLESLAAQLIEFIGRCVPGTIGSTHAPVVRAREVRHAHVISATEAFAISTPELRWNVGTAIFLPIVDIWTAVITEVLLGPLDALMEAAPLHIVPGIWRSLPIIAILAKAGWLGSGVAALMRGAVSSRSAAHPISPVMRSRLRFIVRIPFFREWRHRPLTSARNRNAAWLDLPMSETRN